MIHSSDLVLIFSVTFLFLSIHSALLRSVTGPRFSHCTTKFARIWSKSLIVSTSHANADLGPRWNSRNGMRN